MLRKVGLFVASIGLAVSGASAKSCTWQVAYGDASVAANWDGGLPGIADDAVITGGTMVVSSDLGFQSLSVDNGVVLMTGGTFAVEQLTLGATDGAFGGLVLQGGMLAADALMSGVGEAQLVLAGGTLRLAGATASAGDLPGIRVSTLAGATSTVDTNGKDARVIQDIGKALDADSLMHRWSFNGGSLVDSVTQTSATTAGSVTLESNCAKLKGNGSTEAVVSLGSVFDDCTDEFTVEMWFTLTAAVSWKRMFFACNEAETSLCFVYPVRGTNLDEWKPDVKTSSKDVAVADKAGAFTLNTEYYISVCGRRQASGWQLIFCKRGAETGELLCRTLVNAPADWNLADMTKFTLGHATAGTASAGGVNGIYNEVRVWKCALSDAELMMSARRGPDAEIESAGGGLVKSGTGGLSLEGRNDYVGATIVSAGSLLVGETLRPSHRWTFNAGALIDSEGGVIARKMGSSKSSIISDDDGLVLPGGWSGSGYIQLGDNDALFDGCDQGLTFELWATRLPSESVAWPSIMTVCDPNGQATNNISMMWAHSDQTDRDIVCLYYGSKQGQYADALKPYVDNTEYHLAVSIGPGASAGTWVATFYKQTADGQPLAKYQQTMPTGWTPAALSVCTATLGHSTGGGQTDAHARYSECRIWPCALTESELQHLGAVGKEQVALVRSSLSTRTAADYLQHRWSFNGSSLADSVGGQTAVAHGSVTFDETGVKLPGVKNQTDYVSLGSVFEDCSDAFTVEMWYRQEGAPGWSRPFTIHGGTDDIYRFWFYSTRGTSAGTIQVNAVAGENKKTVDGDADSVLTIGQMFHISVVGRRTASGWQLTVNKRDARTGALVSTVAMMAASGWDLSYMTAFDLGYACVDSKIDNKGYFDEVRVWNRSLTNTELSRSVLAGPDGLPAFDAGLPDETAVMVSSGAALHGQDISVASLAGAGGFFGSYVFGNGSVLDLTSAMPAVFGDLQFTGGATVKVAQATLTGVPVGTLVISGANAVNVVSGGDALLPRQTLFTYQTANIAVEALWTVTGGQPNTVVQDEVAQKRLILRSPKGVVIVVR